MMEKPQRTPLFCIGRVPPGPDPPSLLPHLRLDATGGLGLVWTSADRGESQNTWRTFDTGLFLGRSHINLTEYSWDVETKASTTRFVTIDADSGEVRMHASTQKAYSQNEISELLASAGFREVETWPALSDTTEHMDPHRFVVIAVK